MELTIKRGDIYYAELNPVIGSEQGGTRPVLIISNDIGNKHSPTVIIAPITSRVHTKAKIPTHTLIKDFDGLDKNSIILFEQIRTIDKQRLREYLGTLSQEGKAKHSNRYPFSGKIKCGCCGSSYVARYKTRKDGSRYKAWRCNEAAKHGSPHIDKAGNQVGCTGLSIRNEDATHIMYLVTKSLKYNRNKIINNLTAVIQSIIAMDTTGTDVLKLQEQIKKIEGKRANLIDLYMSNLINKDEFTATRASCDAEIEELQSIIESVDKQREMIEQQQQLLKEIEDAIKEIVSGVEYEDEFYKHILDKMVVQDKDNIDVYLNLLPMKWSYTVAKASKKAVASEWNISEASLPMSVSRAFSSG